LPDDLVSHWNLNKALGMTRQQGFRGVVRRVKQALLDSAGDNLHDPSRSQET